MILFASVIVVAVLLGYALGGRLSRLEGLGIRWWGLVIAGLGVQLIPLPADPSGTDLLVRTIALSVSYTLLVTFAILNLRVTGMVLVLLGLMLNFVVINTNGGMPVSAEALRRSGQEEVLEQLRRSGADKHHLATEEDFLRFLGDVIPIPPPIAQAISVGDILVYAGLVWVVAAAMRGRTRSESPPPTGVYRGRHRPGRTGPRVPPASDLPPLPAATTWGTER